MAQSERVSKFVERQFEIEYDRRVRKANELEKAVNEYREALAHLGSAYAEVIADFPALSAREIREGFGMTTAEANAARSAGRGRRRAKNAPSRSAASQDADTDQDAGHRMRAATDAGS